MYPITILALVLNVGFILFSFFLVGKSVQFASKNPPDDEA